MPETPDDATLLAHIASGDQEALACLAAAYYQRLWRYLARQLAGEVIEDALQEIFLAIWRAAPTFRGDARPSTWIFAIAHHQMVNIRQASQRHAHQLVPENQIAQIEAPVLSEDAIADRLDLLAALRQLSPKHLETLDLVYYLGFTVEETARILGVPTGTVKSRLSQARHTLAALLRQGAIS